MSRFTINLQESSEKENSAAQENPEQAVIASKENPSETKKASSGILKKIAIGFLLIVVVCAGGGFLYWQSVKKTPDYSLAMLIDAARRDDKAQIQQYVDTEAVIEDFMPQVTGKAIELYGRNLPPQTLAKVQQVAAPVIPIIKERAKSELPRVIREKTAQVEKVPYWVIALFANRAVDIKVEGDKATIKSKIPDRPLDLTMKRDGSIWKVVALKDEVLARKIAEKIGQELIAASAKGGIKKAAEQLGVKDLDIIKNAEDLFK
jgi:hypothetical protein